MLTPHTPEVLAEVLATAATRKQTISLCGKSTKRKMAGPIEDAEITVSTQRLARVLQYEPHDLTISVEAGLSWCVLKRMLADNRQMIPLDPPFADEATVGGVIAANCSGPRRRLYGTARDLVIGMKFATLEGKLVQSGGMVVKNVAGLDMAKLLIGSFGTLAAMAVVNFKLLPMPEVERTFLLAFADLAAAIAARDRILASPLQPAAVDLLNRAAAANYGDGQYILAVQATGNEAIIRRYEFELSSMADWAMVEGAAQEEFWSHVREFTAAFQNLNRMGTVVRVSSTLKDIARVLEGVQVPAIARAATGVSYLYFSGPGEAVDWINQAPAGVLPLIEFAPPAMKSTIVLWPNPSGDLALMKRIKQMFDPDNLLNRGRLYRHI